MSSVTSRPTSPLSPGPNAPVVQDKLEIPAVSTDVQTGRKSLQLLSTTHKPVYNVSKGHLERCTVSCPELNIVASDSQEVNPLLEPSKGNTARRVSRSLPLSEKFRRRFPTVRRLQLPQHRRQRNMDWNFSHFAFGEDVEVRDGPDRRLQAQHSRERHESCDMDAHSAHSPLGREAMSSLAKAGMMLATEELDRLSERARTHR
ncbi:hypothetical protein E4U55_005767 [Claviceps digitariae]|nr:hypothetical protein E4U55_005767 [Claviceps digitariae]